MHQPFVLVTGDEHAETLIADGFQTIQGRRQGEMMIKRYGVMDQLCGIKVDVQRGKMLPECPVREAFGLVNPVWFRFSPS